MKKTASSRLPSGDYFESWETIEKYSCELHVDINDPSADDGNDGSAAMPFASISAAAAIAGPGTRVIIHKGIYRECVRPAMGGTAPENMISYESFQNDEVIIKASEEVNSFSLSTDWRLNSDPFEEVSNDTRIWQHKLDPDMFRGYNPFCAVNILHDRLFIEYDKQI